MNYMVYCMQHGLDAYLCVASQYTGMRMIHAYAHDALQAAGNYDRTMTLDTSRNIDAMVMRCARRTAAAARHAHGSPRAGRRREHGLLVEARAQVLEHGSEEVAHRDDAEEPPLLDHRQVAHLRGVVYLGPRANGTRETGTASRGDQMRYMGGGRERGNQSLAAASPSRRSLT